MELWEMTLAEINRLVRTKRTSPTEVAKAFIERVRELDGKIHAFISFEEEDILRFAKEVEGRMDVIGDSPVLGVPVAIKDNIHVAGWRTTCASKILENYVAPYDATVIKKLKDAGAIPFGKTNLDEFAMGSSTENSAFGVTKNPWDLERVPGGSSGGSAAAVSARMVPAALGSDTGGSIRQPASFTGIVGLKPTYGRVSRYGLVAFASSLDQIGPMARTAEDIARLLYVISGFDPMDSTSLKESFRWERIGITGRKIGVVKEALGEGVDEDVRNAMEEAIKTFEELGADVEEVSIPALEYALPAYYIVAPAEASSNLARYDGVRYGPRHEGGNIWETYRKTRTAGFGIEVKRRIIIGNFVLSSGYYDAYYLKALKVRTLLKRQVDEILSRVSLIFLPTSPTPAFRIGERIDDPLKMYLSDVFTVLANLIGYPAVSFPIGFSKDGLPIGGQFIAPPLREDSLLDFVSAFEEATGYYNRAPEVARKGGEGK